MPAPQGPHAHLYRVVTGGWQAVFWEEGSEEGEQNCVRVTVDEGAGESLQLRPHDDFSILQLLI